MYIKNKRDNNKIEDFGSYQTLFLIEFFYFEIAYSSYTNY
ncbi:hypothetical protein DFQ05_2172 [Winogradskyella wandonensis]|uniref:Uncharacterized protein n=1 Tax=Winogradskyella wandonensis TaxID=1442586 RepID=A0A4R1KPC7_9FLAO|nr:hypothetical protein DFQ05_2172 [Winogradskyella wandonensis]